MEAMPALRTCSARVPAVLALIAASALAHRAAAQAVGDFDGDGFADLAIGVPGESINSAIDAGAVQVIYGSASKLTATGSQQWHLDRSGVPGEAETGDQLGRAIAAGDFNGDGFDDLAIGMSGREISSDEGAGAVLVLYGSAAGIAAANARIWDQDTSGIEDGAQANDAFGNALASGDFNGDGFDDLAVGVPGEDSDLGLDAGAVSVLYGTGAGLDAPGNQFFQQDTGGINGTAEGGDSFGEALATGDFNNDGNDDLVIAVSNEDFNGEEGAGIVHVLFGTVGGLTAAGAQTWDEDQNNVPESAEDDDNFGAALAAGDFDNDGFDDLAIGVAEESVGTIANAGGVLVLRGSAIGLTVNDVKFFTQDKGEVRDACQAGDHFGNALAAADFNGDGFADLAIGVPLESIDGISQCGAVNLLLGSANGLRDDGNQFWHQSAEGIIDKNEPKDRFGSTLAAGDFDGDGRADLAVGVPHEDIGAPDAGAMNVLYGSANGVKNGPDQFWHQDVAGIADTSNEDDGFGAANID